MRKLPLMIIALLVLAACGGGNGGKTPQETAVAEEVELVSESGPSAPQDVRSKGTPWSNPIGRYDEVFNDSNYIQYQYAERLGIDPVHSLYDAYNTRRPLVKIESGEHYQVDNLTHSMPYLVPEAATLLEEIGDEFGAMLAQRGGDPSGSKILVTSLLRSPYTVKRLRRVNRNAVDSSTHMFGTTFDISWSKFHHPDTAMETNDVVLKGILAEVLLRKREEGRCLVKYERKTPCFHITVTR